MKYPLPKRLGVYQGKTFSRYSVVLTQSGLDRELWSREGIVEVVAESPKAACWLVKDEFAPLVNHPTEIECAGPKGGLSHLFIGWESMIWAKMCATPKGEQLMLFAR